MHITRGPNFLTYNLVYSKYIKRKIQNNEE